MAQFVTRFATRVFPLASALIVSCAGPSPVVVTEIVTIQVERDSAQTVITQTPDRVNVPDRDPMVCEQGTFELMLTALLGGTCDFAEMGRLVPDQILFVHELAAQGQIAYQAVAAPEWEQVTLNLAPPADAPNGGLPFFADWRVRRAVAFGTNREKMIGALYSGDGQALYSFLPEDHPALLAEASVLYSDDPEQARILLSAAGWQDLDGDGYVEAFNDLEGDLGCGRGRWMIPAGTLFEISYTTSQSDFQSMAAERFAADMAEIGIAVNIEQVSDEELAERLKTRRFQMAGFSLTSDVILESGELFAGQNIYHAPTDELAPAMDLLQNKPALLFGIPLLEVDFIMGVPAAERLPQGYTLAYGSSIPTGSNGFAGQNISGWCNGPATLAAHAVDEAADLDQASGPLRALQAHVLEEAPLIPLFQHIEYDLRSPHLCGPGRGPRQVATWNVEEWYFAETCP